MNNIELYAGDEKKLSRSEETVLTRVIEWLVENNVPAVVLTNFWLGKTQIDIFVGTPTATLQLEVKGHRRRVSGLQNGRWESTDWKGNTRTYRNGYLQALGANQTLRDHMRRFLSTADDIPYPNGAVIFDANIPDGSDLYNDRRVRVCGLDQLDELLSSQSLSPWPLTWIRDFAQKRKFIAQSLPTQTPRTPRSDLSPVSLHEPPISSKSVQLVRHRAEALREVVETWSPATEVRTTATIAAQSRVATMLQTSIQGAREAEYQSPSNAPPRISKPFRRLLRHSPIAFALLAVALLYKQGFQPASSPKFAAANSSQSAPLTHTQSHHADSHRRTQAHHTNVVEPGQVVTTGASHLEQSSQSTALPPAPITCPAGVDRLGCNGKTGVLAAPECPLGFRVSADTCIRDGNM